MRYVTLYFPTPDGTGCLIYDRESRLVGVASEMWGSALKTLVEDAVNRIDRGEYGGEFCLSDTKEIAAIYEVKVA